ncbi:MAG: hypothetical protein QOF76_192 [Solirubrobacteraceae bacterium]|nr:hypothetical protein [Solirubrobacteraceae bacterium]
MTTRRDLFAGAAVGTLIGVAPALADEPTAPNRAVQKPVLRGRAIAVTAFGRRAVVAHDRRRTIADIDRGQAHVLDVGGQPLEVAVSPGGRLAAVTTASWDEPALALVDLHRHTVLTRVAVGPAPSHVAFTPDGARLIVTGGEQEGTAHVLDAHTFKVLAHSNIGIVPRGIAPVADSAWVAINGAKHVAQIDTRTGHVLRRLHVAWLPDRAAASPDGRRLLVSHGGTHSARVSVLNLHTGHVTRHDAGRLPSGVAWTRRGRALVALGGAGAIVVLGHHRAHHVGGAPRGLVVAGGRAWTVDALTGAVARVRV